MEKIEKNEKDSNKQITKDINHNNELKSLDINLNENHIENNHIEISNHDKNRKEIQDELIYFRNDILKDIKNTEIKINKKYDIQNNIFQNRLEDIKKETNILKKKFSNLNEAISYEKIVKEKLSNLEIFKIKTDETILAHEFRIKVINKELNDALNKYDKIILDNILYPGVIGNMSKFKTFHDLIDYLLLNINKLLNSKEKDIIENRENRKYIQNLIENFKTKIDFYLNNATEFTRKVIKDFEEKINNKTDDLNKEISMYKKEFNQKINSLEQKINDLENNIKKENEENLDKLNLNIMKEIFDIKNNIRNIENKNDINHNDFEQIKQEVNFIKVFLLDFLQKLDTKGQTSINNNNNNSIFNADNPKIKIKSNNNDIFIENNINNSFNNNKKIIDNNINNSFNTTVNNIINRNKDNINNNQNNSKIVRNNLPYLFNVNSIVKQYIDGLIKLNDIYKNNPSNPPKLTTIKNMNNKILNEQKNINNNNEKELNNKNINKKEKEKDLENKENEDSIKFKSSPITSDYKKFIENNNNDLNNSNRNSIIKPKNILHKSNNQYLDDKTNNSIKNYKLFHNNNIKNYNNFKFLNEDFSNIKVKNVDLTISKDNNSGNNIFNNYNNDLNMINFIRELKKENSITYTHNLINKNNKTLKGFFLKNSMLLESKKVQTPKEFKKIKTYFDLSLKYNNYNNNQNLLSDRLNLNSFSLNLKDKMKSSEINNYNKNIEKQRNININRVNSNNIYETNKYKRILSSIDKRNDKTRFNNIEVTFDNTQMNSKKEKQIFENDIEQIKGVLSYDEKEIFLEKIKKIENFKDKKINKRNNNDI